MAHIISYSHVTRATIPADVWDEAWFTIQSWKGYLQSFPGFLNIHLAARPLENGDVRMHVATIWEYPEQLEAWRESHWSAQHILTALSHQAYNLDEETFEDFD